MKFSKKEINEFREKNNNFHAKVIDQFNLGDETIIGFHGQTIYHNYEEKISRQLGNGKLLNQLTKKNIVYDFRSNDIKNGGQGAPLTPIFHNLICFKIKLNYQFVF